MSIELFTFILSIAAIFTSGITAHLYAVLGDKRDLIWSAVGFSSGCFLLTVLLKECIY